MPYKPSSKVLFVSVCSLNKAEGGRSGYTKDEAISSALPTMTAVRLRERRERVRKLVVGPDAPQRQGVEVSELFYNEKLAKGIEFGGLSSEHGGPSVRYRPAVERYTGRFFLGMGRSRLASIRDCDHHVIFLSGLYGVVWPLEPIQLYSCPLDSQVAALWRDDELLTEVLGDYVGRHGIRKVIDLTAIEAYRRLVDWRSIGHQADVLHCFWSMGAGADALIRFGETLRWQLLEMQEEKLLQLGSDERTGQIIYRSAALPGEGFPEEEVAETYPPQTVVPVLNDQPVVSTEADGGSAWRFSTTRDFQKELWRHRNQFEKVTNAIVEICGNPEAAGEGLTGPLQRYRKYKLEGDFRIIYRRNREQKVIHCCYFRPRDDRTYKGLI